MCDVVQGICNVLLLPFTAGRPSPAEPAASSSGRGKDGGRYSGGASGGSSVAQPTLLATLQHTLFRVSAVGAREWRYRT